MKRFSGLLVFLPLVIAVIMCSCGREGPTDEERDKTTIESVINGSESDWFEFTRHEENDSSAGSKDKGDSLIDPVLWWRNIPPEGRTRHLDIDVVGDSAYVTRTVYSMGKFNIIGRMTDSTWVGKKKSLTETAKMHAIFKRTGNVNDTNRGWKLVKLSGAVGSSDSIHTVRIDSVRIQCASYSDTVLINPLGYMFDKENALTFAPGESVTVTLYANTNDANAFLHVFQPNFPYHYRIPMQNNGDNTYTNATPWHVQIIPAVRFVVFDLLRYDTIHDTDYAYDFDGWLYPYRVQ